MDAVTMSINHIVTDATPPPNNSDNPQNDEVFLIPFVLIAILVTGLCCTFCCYVFRIHRSTVGRDSAEDIETAQSSTSEAEVLTKVNYKKKWLKKNSSRLKSKMCPICLDNFRHKDEISFCICGHAYHHKCIMKWLEVKRVCPVCQRKVKGYRTNERTPLLSGTPAET